MLYCTYNLLNMFWALGQQTMRPGWQKLCDSESHNFPHPGCIACCSAPNSRPPATKALHTICGNNTSIVSSSWWWAYKCPKHVEQIISAIKHSVTSSWFSSLRLYYDKQTNIHQIHGIFIMHALPCTTNNTSYQSQLRYISAFLHVSPYTAICRATLNTTCRLWSLLICPKYIKVFRPTSKCVFIYFRQM